MDDNTINSQTSISDESKRETHRSASYPVSTVYESVNFSNRINEKFSLQEFTRDELAITLNMHVNSISRYVATCSQFGLLEKKNGKYKLTELFRDIFLHENETQKKLAIIESFGQPKLYKELIEKFDNNVVPEELYNTLIKHHNITPAASKDAAKVFITSAIEIGVMNENNRTLKYHTTKSVIEKTGNLENVNDQTNEPFQETVTSNLPDLINDYDASFKLIATQQSIKVPIYLTKNKMAMLSYSSDISKKDIKLLEHAISGILLKLDLESEDDGSI